MDNQAFRAEGKLIINDPSEANWSTLGQLSKQLSMIAISAHKWLESENGQEFIRNIEALGEGHQLVIQLRAAPIKVGVPIPTPHEAFLSDSWAYDKP